MAKVALRCNHCGKTVHKYPSQVYERNFCDIHCLGKYKSKHATGVNAPRWKDGTRTDRERVQWHMPWHHRADNKGYVYRYVIVAELTMGRELKPGEVVHHIDGNAANDHPDNLQVLSGQSEHARLHDFGGSRWRSK